MKFNPKPTTLTISANVSSERGYVRGFLLTIILSIAFTLASFAQIQHHLVAGSFNNLRAANDYSNALRLKGYSPQVVFSGNATSQYRVSIYQSPNKTEVSQYRRQLPGQGKSYWILTVGAQLDPVLPEAGRVVDRGLSGTKYHLVIGGFSTQDAANRSVAAKMAQGFDAYVLQPDANASLYRVAVMNSFDRKEVETYQRMLRRSNYNPGMIVTEASGNSVVPGINNGQANLKLGGTMTFHLIDGSFATYQQAKVHEAALRSKGHDAMVLAPAATNTNRYRVSAYRSNNRQQVVNYQSRFKAGGKKLGWILAVN